MVFKEIYNENEVDPKISVQEEIKLVLKVVLFCTMNRTYDLLSMEVALKLLFGLRPQDDNFIQNNYGERKVVWREFFSIKVNKCHVIIHALCLKLKAFQ